MRRFYFVVNCLNILTISPGEFSDNSAGVASPIYDIRYLKKCLTNKTERAIMNYQMKGEKK